MKHFAFAASFLSACLLAATLPAHADPISWTTWTSSNGSTQASGTIGSINVVYTGQTSGLLTNYPSWGPTSTFQGGKIGNAPPAANNSVQLEGGTPMTETITFSTPVSNPVVAIWSLGNGGNPATFNFNQPITFQVGGPSAEYGGQAITVAGNTVTGAEGNGVVQVNGTYSTISFTTPVSENYYAFTVGQDTAPTIAPTPEPSGLVLLGSGILGMAGMVRRKLRRG